MSRQDLLARHQEHLTRHYQVETHHSGLSSRHCFRQVRRGLGYSRHFVAVLESGCPLAWRCLEVDLSPAGAWT